LAEFRSRNKEFGSNDSLHLNPLNRSFSDPWLLKGDQREMDNELNLSKSVRLPDFLTILVLGKTYPSHMAFFLHLKITKMYFIV
jgi:hypothetical protein